MATRVLDILHVSLAEQRDAAAMAAIEAQAKRDGLKIVREAEGHGARAVREWKGDDSVRTVRVANSRDFLANLAAIASGKIKGAL